MTRGFYALFIVITWLGISTLSQLIGSENFIWCVSPTDSAEIFISLKAAGGLSIHRLEVKYQFFVHPNINKTNWTKENNIFLIFFCHGVDLFRNRPKSSCGVKSWYTYYEPCISPGNATEIWDITWSIFLKSSHFSTFTIVVISHFFFVFYNFSLFLIYASFLLQYSNENIQIWNSH